MSGYVVAPVRVSQFGPSCNHDRSQPLVAHQSQICPVHNGASLPAALAIGTVTTRAESRKYSGAALCVAGWHGRVRWKVEITELFRPRPGPHSMHKNINLLVC